MTSDAIVVHFSYPQLSLYQLFDTVLSHQTLFLCAHSVSDPIIEVCNHLILCYTVAIIFSVPPQRLHPDPRAQAMNDVSHHTMPPICPILLNAVRDPIWEGIPPRSRTSQGL